MISVILPMLDEEREVGAALAALAEQGSGHEVIVADGGSSDRTVELATAGGARVIVSGRGRGRQMNAGAAVAGGEILLFLHADTRLPAGALAAVHRALAQAPAVMGGAFLKQYDGAGPLLTAVGGVLNRVRTQFFKRFVGTQAIFVRRAAFERLGGYREWPLFEDVDLSDRLRASGRLAVVPSPVVVSIRRYRRRGTVRQVLVNGIVLGLFRLGMSPARLERLYEGWR